MKVFVFVTITCKGWNTQSTTIVASVIIRKLKDKSFTQSSNGGKGYVFQVLPFRRNEKSM